MKVIALGGAGQEGSRTVRDLAASVQVESVVIGDLDIDAANRLKQEIGSDKVSTVQVDATDKAGLIEVLKDVDVAISFVGPYFQSSTALAGPVMLEAEESMNPGGHRYRVLYVRDTFYG